MIIETIENLKPAPAFAALRHLPMPFIFSGSKDGARKFSYSGADPSLSIKTGVRGTVAEGAYGLTSRFNDPFEAASEIIKLFRYSGPGPFPFNGGGAGYFSYDLKNIIEPRMACAKKRGGLGAPEAVIGFYDPVFVYDHIEDKGYLISSGDKRERFGRIKKILLSAVEFTAKETPPAEGFTSNVKKEDFIAAILKAQEYISEGDIYQINLSHRLKVKWQGDPFQLYLSLIGRYPAPFSSFMDFGIFQVISNSPERLMKVEGKKVETSPIKGTRKRGKTPEEDRALIEELRMSKKERAEHVMIVDLERNDLGRISVPGTVEVASFEAIESYTHLHHMSSTISGQLLPGVDGPLGLKKIFPGGSITGAPKIRAMEIIEELEASARGIYTGGVGWMDFNGDMDIAMAIRTAVYKDGELYLNVGGGIVADSVPEEEYRETILKAKDFLDTMGLQAG